MPIQILKEPRENYVRNCWAHNIQPGSRICPASPTGELHDMRLRHAAEGLHVVQNPHRSQPEVHRAASKTGAVPVGAKNSPSTATPAAFPRKSSPSKRKNADLGCFERAGRTFSRTRRDNVATLKPPTPLLTPNKGPLKPTTPLRPKTAPKTPISLPQRRWRFQSHTDTSEQRRSRFQTTGPPGRQRLAATPWAATTPPPPNFACNSIG